MKENEIYIPVSPKKESTIKRAYVRTFEESVNAPNIIFIMTPIVSVKDKLAKSFMEGLYGNGCNVFALDFLGIGESEGDVSDITFKTMKSTLLSLIEYIQEHFNDEIHFYGATGTGGIIGQSLCSDIEVNKNIKTFSQFGVGISNDLSIMGNSRVLRLSYPFIKMLGTSLPEKKMKFKIPKYNGYNAKRENEWYEKTMNDYPGVFDMQFGLLKTLFGMFLSPDSTMRNTPSCPTLVLASKHDRYYYKEYIEKYFSNLKVEKELVWFEDSHLAFYWRAKEINQEVINWVKQG